MMSEVFPTMDVDHIYTPQSIKFMVRLSCICTVFVLLKLLCEFYMDKRDETGKLSRKISVLSEYPTSLTTT